jgi:hypothetical protein
VRENRASASRSGQPSNACVIEFMFSVNGDAYDCSTNWYEESAYPACRITMRTSLTDASTFSAIAATRAGHWLDSATEQAGPNGLAHACTQDSTVSANCGSSFAPICSTIILMSLSRATARSRSAWDGSV